MVKAEMSAKKPYRTLEEQIEYAKQFTKKVFDKELKRFKRQSITQKHSRIIMRGSS